jgi:hypothetical protein
MQIFKKGKGNKAIDKTNAKRIENGKIVPLFQVIPPTVGPEESLKAYSEQLWSSSDSWWPTGNVCVENFIRTP